MSQKNEGLLNEEEVKSYLNETFNLKLNRDALLNPRKETVMDLYARFLDYRRPNWRRVRNPKAELLTIMVKRLRFMLQGYIPNDKREFHSGDLIMPDRRRTNFFLNALIYIKAQVDDVAQDWQQWSAEWKSEQEVAQELIRDLEEAKMELENLAIKKSQAKPPDELKEEIRKTKALVDEFEFKHEETERERTRIKNLLLSLSEQKAELENMNSTLRKQVEQKERIMHSLDNGKSLKTIIVNLEQQNQLLADKLQNFEKKSDNLRSTIAKIEEFLSRDNVDEDEWPKEIELTKAFISKASKRKTARQNERRKLIDDTNSYSAEENSLKANLAEVEAVRYKQLMQAKISEKQAQTDLKEAEANRKMEVQQYTEEINKLEENLAHLDKSLVKLEEDRSKLIEQHEDYVRKLEQKSSAALESYRNSTAFDQEAIMELQTLKKRINDLIGSPQYSIPLIRNDSLGDQVQQANREENFNGDQTLPANRGDNFNGDQSLPANRTYTIK